MPVNIKITGDEKEPITPPEPEGVKIEVVEKDKLKASLSFDLL